MIKRCLPRGVAPREAPTALAITLFIIRIPLPTDVPGPYRSLNFAGIGGYRVPARLRIDGQDETGFRLGWRRIEGPKDRVESLKKNRRLP
jgi:hypothetical protein